MAMFSFVDLKNEVATEYIGTCMFCLHIKFYAPAFSGSVVTAIKPKLNIDFIQSPFSYYI
jgi:hypothetical protein